VTTLTTEGSPSIPWIKICGLRDALSVRQCVSLEVNAIGFVFAPSVRQVSLESALRLAEPARGRVQIVAVVREMTAELPRIIKEFDPDMLQIDYAEQAVKAWLSSEAAARGIDAPRALLPVMREGDQPPELWPSMMLFEGQQSGVGQLADWTQAAAWARHGRLVLAGGLSSSNVGDAIRQVRPFGVDVSSAVERERGLKCPQLIEEFVMAVRSTSRTMQEHG
jgi:phosphoribosylanthranilate isomerase